jgi:hypothetical protein
MMSPERPVIFISAVSKELRTTRDLVAKTLLALGYQPKWQDIAPTETGDLCSVLRKWVDQSHAVIQIVGHRYGCAPNEPDPVFGLVSYPQYEALYARAKGKKIWYILLEEHHPTDPAEPEPEPDHLRNLQAAYRQQVKAHHGLYYPSANALSTENIVLRLRDDLARLRRKGQQLAIVILVLLTLTIGVMVWDVVRQEMTSDKVTALEQQNQTLLVAVRELPSALSAAQHASSHSDKSIQLASAYASLDASLGLPPGTLEKELPAFAQKLLTAPDTSLIDKASAQYVLSNYRDAEKLALRAKDVAVAAAGQPVHDAIAALRLAGQSAEAQIQYARALDHARAAAILTSEQIDVVAWAGIQTQIGWLLYLDGQYNQQATLMQRVRQACEKTGHYEDPTTLLARHLLAIAQESQGKYAESEAEFRAIIPTRERVLGLDHPDTLKSRNSFAIALDSQGKYAESEAESRAVLAIRERVLGSEHPGTLATRNNLGAALYSHGKHAEAEAEHRAVLVIQERVLGPEHPDTLNSRMNLANAQDSLGKHAEAEAEHRAVLAVRERVIGLVHPDTLKSRMNLALALDSQCKHAEGEAEYRAVLAIQERVLGPEHPDTLRSCFNLSVTLEKFARKEDALALARRALAGRNRVLGENHPHSQAAKQRVECLEQK